MAKVDDWPAGSGWIAERPLYLRVVWADSDTGPATVTDIVDALWNVELLYDFAVLLAHPAYQVYDLQEPEEFFRSGWQALDRGHRLQAVSVEHHSPLLLLAVIPVGADAVWAITQSVEKIANFRLNRRKLKAEVTKAEAEARRADAEADSIEYQKLLDRRGASVTAERLRAQIQAAPLQITEAELTDNRPAA